MSIRWTLGAALTVLAASPSAAQACSCVAPAVDTSWNWSDGVFHVDVKTKATRGAFDYYLVEVMDVFDGCANVGDTVILKTSVSGATCGTRLSRGEWLVNGDFVGVHPTTGLRAYSIGLCDYNVPWASVTADDTDFLFARMGTCDDTGVRYCADGSLPLECLADPCDGASCALGGTCIANFCGGCNYEFWDDFAGMVCSGP